MCSDRTNIILATFRNPVPKVIFSSVRENLHVIWKGIDLIIIIIVFPHKKRRNYDRRGPCCGSRDRAAMPDDSTHV